MSVSYIVIPLMPLCISQLAASSQFGRLGVVLVFSIFFFFFSPAPGIQDLTVVTCFNASRNKSHIKSHASYHLCRQAPGPPSSVAVNFHKQKPCWSHHVFSVVKPNEFLNMTWQPKKPSNTAVPQHTTVTCPTRGSLFFSGFCLHQGLKATTSSCQAATWQAPHEALQSTSFTYWKIGLDSDPFIDDLKSKMVSIIPDVELHICRHFSGIVIYTISSFHFLLTKHMNTQEPY